MDLTSRTPLILLTLALLLAPSLAAAQLGEIAGALNFSVPPGTNQTLQLYVLNQANVSIPFEVQLPNLKAFSNATTPTISASPASGVIPPGSEFAINVTVQMPASDIPHVGSWSAFMGVAEISNSSSGGSSVEAGVAKQVNIGVAAYTTTTSTSTIATTIAQVTTPQVTVPGYITLIPYIWLLIILFIIWYIYHLRKRFKKLRQAANPEDKKQ